MNLESEIHKIKFNQSTNNYRLLFKEIGNENYCEINLSNADAKNVALSKEGIPSDRLKTYNLIINILSALSIKIDKVIINKNNNNIISTIYLQNGDKELSIDSNFIDSIIISLKSFSSIYINDSLFASKDELVYEKKNLFVNVLSDELMSNKAKINRLLKTLNELVENENYESAAIIRDQIDKIKNN